MTEVSRTLVLVNPASGGGRGQRRWRQLRQAIPQLEAAESIVVQGAAAAREALYQRLEAETFQRLLVLGGDGTAHLVGNVLLEREASGGRAAASTAFGIVPTGTGSDLARHLGVPKRPLDAARRLLQASARPLDAIELTTDDGRRRFALNTVSLGVAGAVTLAINTNPNRGQLSYLAATVRELLRYRPVPCGVIADGEALGPKGYFLVAVTNGRYFGKGMKVAPSARSDDGRLELVLVPPMSLWSLPFRMPQFLTGRHVRWPEVTTRQVECVRCEPAPGHTPFDLDGEPFDATPATLRVRPGALRVLV